MVWLLRLRKEVAIQHEMRSECDILRQHTHLVLAFLRSSLVRFHWHDEHLSIRNGSLWKETVQIGCLEQTLRQMRVKNEKYKEKKKHDISRRYR